jgi:O-6-methylguanine DNA methyltransferase
MEKISFKENVLEIVRNIPRGGVLSYGEVARRAGNPRAARAVGAMMKANHDATVPCHRVIRSDGEMGGYNNGGSSAKLKKLRAEGAQLFINR